MTTKRTVPVRIQGKEYRIRADAEDDSVLRAAALLDETMNKVRARAGTADSADVAVLAALNLANRLTGDRAAGVVAPDAGLERRIQELIRLVESAVGDAKPALS